MNIYLDIETIPGQRKGLKDEIGKTITHPGSMKKAETIAKWEAEQKPAAIEEAWRKTSFNGDQGEIVCISWAVDDGKVESVARMMSVEESEPYLLIDFFYLIQREIDKRHGRMPVWIGHNVRKFDLRFIFHRAVILGIRPPFRLPHDARPGSDRVFDTMEAWAGLRNRISLDRLCRALGIPLKGSELDGEEIDGSKVWDFVQAGRIDEVVCYCEADVERVRQLHRRLTFVRDVQTAIAI